MDPISVARDAGGAYCLTCYEQLPPITRDRLVRGDLNEHGLSLLEAGGKGRCRGCQEPLRVLAATFKRRPK